MNSDKRKQSLQDVFLNNVRKNKTLVTAFLTNGVKLQGIVTSFDNFCVLLKRESSSQLIYKHALSTIMPQGALNLQEFNEDNQEPSAASSDDGCCNKDSCCSQ